MTSDPFGMMTIIRTPFQRQTNKQTNKQTQHSHNLNPQDLSVLSLTGSLTWVKWRDRWIQLRLILTLQTELTVRRGGQACDTFELSALTTVCECDWSRTQHCSNAS